MGVLEDSRAQTAAVYERNAKDWDRHRPRVFFEQAWIDRFKLALPENGRVLDLGCGAGEPVSAYLINHGFRLTGLDCAASMLDISRSRFPQADWVQMDMRQLNLDRVFDGILSWDGFFHLTQAEQRAALPLFASHLADQGVLLLTIGHIAGEVTGTVEGETVYHASLAEDEYREILTSLGFNRIEIKLEDESCGFHSVLLAKRGC